MRLLVVLGWVLPRLVVSGVVGVVVCLCLSVGFKVFSAMFFYMYENMAEFCLLGRNRHAGADDKKTRQDVWRVMSRRMLKPARTPRYNRHTGSKEAAERDQPAAGTARRASSRDRRSAYSFFQRQAVDRHTNAKTPEPELEPAMQATMKARHQGTAPRHGRGRQKAMKTQPEQPTPEAKQGSRHGNRQQAGKAAGQPAASSRGGQ